MAVSISSKVVGRSGLQTDLSFPEHRSPLQTVIDGDIPRTNCPLTVSDRFPVTTALVFVR